MKIELDGHESRRELEAAQAALTHLLSTHPEAANRIPPSCDDQGCPAHYAEPRLDDGLNNKGDAIDNTGGAQPSDRGGVTEEAPGKSAEPAATETSQTTGTAEGAGSVGSDAPVDTKGVAFNVETCSKAAEPFYASGPRAGQWKKRKGVDDAVYDQWYSGELAKLVGIQETATEAQPEKSEDDHTPDSVNTAAAFGSPQVQGGTPSTQAPQDTGTFMGWVSEKQAGGLLSQADIQDAYAQAGVQVTDLFPPTDPAVVSGHIAKLYGILSAKAGA